ncbi:MAG: glycosyltransferase [Deltaproteobacteria bacterium]|nr:glycosyltransferase [Deltaproteobacteria bacterium]
MNIHIITSSYPATPEDPSGTAGLFVRQFALDLVGLGHRVIVQPVARKGQYRPDPGLTIVPSPWRGGDRELASMSLASPRNWGVFLHYFIRGAANTVAINKAFSVDRALCMWAVPSGILGWLGRRRGRTPYDVWALGSDIWKVRRVPVLGRKVLTTVMRNADRVFADGLQLCRDVNELTGVACEFLPSSRRMPPPDAVPLEPGSSLRHLLFVGRYHPNKGADLLVEAVACLPHEQRRWLRVHMFGLGPLEDQLRGMIREMNLEGCVRLNGPIEAQEFSNYLAAVSFLAIPSRIESIPVVLSDALQLGTPVISMPVGDLEPFVREHGCGVVADDVSAEAFASAITEALGRDRDSFREGVARAYERLDLRKAVARWVSLREATRPAA